MSLRQPTAGGAPCLRRGILAACIALATAGVLSSCSSGDDAATLKIRPDLVDTTVGNIKVQNVVLIVPKTPGDAPVAVSAAVINNGDRAQKLVSVAMQGSAKKLTLAGENGKKGPLTVPAHGSVLIGGKHSPSATLDSAASKVRGDLGGYRKVTFMLSVTGEVPIQAYVVPNTGYYRPFGPTSSPSATVSPGGAGAPSGSSSPGSSESPSGAAGSPSGASKSPSGAASSPSGGKKSPNTPSTGATP